METGGGKSARAFVTTSDSESSSTSSEEEADVKRHRSAVKSSPAAVSKPRVITSSSDSDDSCDDVESVTLLKNRVTPDKSRKTSATLTPLPRQSIYTSSDDDDSNSDSVTGTTPLKKVKPSSSMSTPPSGPKVQSKKPAQSSTKKPPLPSTTSGSSKAISKPSVPRESSTDVDLASAAKNSKSTVKDGKKQHHKTMDKDNAPDSVLGSVGQMSKKEEKKPAKSKSTTVPHHYMSSLFGDALAKSAAHSKVGLKSAKEEKIGRKDLTSSRIADIHKSSSSTVASMADRTSQNKLSRTDVDSAKSKHSTSESRHVSKSSSGAADKKSGSQRALKPGYDMSSENTSRKILESESLKMKRVKQEEGHISTAVEAESDESPLIRPGNIFEKMEKQESSGDKSDESRLYGPSVDAAAAAHRRSIVSEIAMFMPESDDEDHEPIVETGKLSIERLKEDSAKEETIEEAVKAIIEFTKEPTTPPHSVSKATDPEPLEDTSAEAIDDDTGLSDDVGELNAAIGNLIEKELEPAGGDSLTSPSISGDKSSESDTTMTSPTHYHASTPRGLAEPKSELLPFVGNNSSGSFKEEHGAIKMEVERRAQTPAHDEQNVTSFMSRLEKATADVVDFASISAAAAASRKVPEKVSAGEVTACSKPEVSSRLFASAITSAAVKTEDEKPVVVVKAECSEPVEVVKPEPPEFPLSTRIFSSPKQPEVHGISSVEKGSAAVVSAETASGEDSAMMADLYEFKDDDDEANVRQKDFVLHKRSRKRHADSESNDAADVDLKKLRSGGGGHAKVDQHEAAPTVTTEQCHVTTTSTSESQSSQSSWRTNMDLVIEAVARGEFERGDDFNYYSTQNTVTSSSAGRGRRGRGTSRDDSAHKSVPPASTPGCLPSSLPGMSVEAFTAAAYQRSLPAMPAGAGTSSALTGLGRCSPKLLLSGTPAQQLQQLQRMYPPGSLPAQCKWF